MKFLEKHINIILILILVFLFFGLLFSPFIYQELNKLLLPMVSEHFPQHVEKMVLTKQIAKKILYTYNVFFGYCLFFIFPIKMYFISDDGFNRNPNFWGISLLIWFVFFCIMAYNFIREVVLFWFY